MSRPQTLGDCLVLDFGFNARGLNVAVSKCIWLLGASSTRNASCRAERKSRETWHPNGETSCSAAKPAQQRPRLGGAFDDHARSMIATAATAKHHIEKAASSHRQCSQWRQSRLLEGNRRHAARPAIEGRASAWLRAISTSGGGLLAPS